MDIPDNPVVTTPLQGMWVRSLVGEFLPALWYGQKKKVKRRTYLVVQWLRLCTPHVGGPGSIPGGGTRFHMATESSHVATKRSHLMQLRPDTAK